MSRSSPSQNQECLLTGMRSVFEYIGGVPWVIRFDNMSTAVVKVLDGGERELTDGFTRFKLHYRFNAEFCNPASGYEKAVVSPIGQIHNLLAAVQQIVIDDACVPMRKQKASERPFSYASYRFPKPLH